jgi:hypothetical protein
LALTLNLCSSRVKRIPQMEPFEVRFSRCRKSLLRGSYCVTFVPLAALQVKACWECPRLNDSFSKLMEDGCSCHREAEDLLHCLLRNCVPKGRAPRLWSRWPRAGSCYFAPSICSSLASPPPRAGARAMHFLAIGHWRKVWITAGVSRPQLGSCPPRNSSCPSRVGSSTLTLGSSF